MSDRGASQVKHGNSATLMKIGPKLSRRELATLAGAVAVAGIGSVTLRRVQPVGTKIDDSPVVQEALAQEAPEAGNPDGDLLLLVFSDFNCPICRSTHQQMMQAVDADGQIRLKFLDWPIFGRDSEDAARIAIAADVQGLYLDVHGGLMRQGGRADAARARDVLVQAGGSLSALDDILAQDGARIQDLLSRNALHAFGLGLGGTPGHLLGRILLRGRTSKQEFTRAFRRARRLG